MSKIDCEKLSDAEIVQFCHDNLDYFRCVVEHYQSMLSYFVKRISGLSEAEIEEVLQEAFIKVYTNLNAYIPEMSFKTWIFQITRNQTIDYLRKNKKKLSQLELKPLVIDRLSFETFFEGKNPESELLDEEKHQRLLKSVYQLPVLYREVAILRFIEGKSYDEVSDITMTSLGTVSSLINRAKKLLFSQWQEEALS